eukprot:COSAG05_NODE_3372_length_2106_cov_2.549078_1_plen_128_part_10
MEYESYLLRVLAFDVEVELPHRFLFNYLRSLRHYCRRTLLTPTPAGNGSVAGTDSASAASAPVPASSGGDACGAESELEWQREAEVLTRVSLAFVNDGDRGGLTEGHRPLLGAGVCASPSLMNLVLPH